ncbi:MAG TPA: SH3 domain-containing protein [Patescibacteria group bacterium]|nr:SH3 domain-containing protein [Patescibacteria group bacterium]
MLRKPVTIFWIITGLAAVLLLVFTLSLRSRALVQKSAGFTGTITGVDSAVYLYEQPSASSHIITLLDLGDPVIVTDSDGEENTLWYYVNSVKANGWLPADRVSRNPP